ncbi:MAG TPA: ATP-binding protein [Thermomicrobiales bacterium]|nr:ATP-binding protein [Thermomicrobiales bacterium]
MTADEQSDGISDADERVDRQRAMDRTVVASYEAALAIASEVDLERVLQRIVDLAREVVPARYGALGVADDQGLVVQFFVSGVSPDERAQLGEAPQGHGLIGALIRDRKPLLVPDIAADPRSVGVPPHHPMMKTLLGVPILASSKALGNLYLADRRDGRPFTNQDLEAIEILAAHAASAIDRAQLYRQVEESRRQAEAQRDHLRVILDNLPAAVIIDARPDGAAELANAAAVELMLGPVAPAGAMPTYGRDFRLLDGEGQVVPEEDRPGRRAMRGDAIRNRQMTLERSDGASIPVLVQAAPLRDGDGSIGGSVVVFQDVTRLREAEQLKDDFLSLVSHEFRTPLTAIQGGARLLAAGSNEISGATRRELLDDVVQESERLTRMLGNMLSLAAIQAGRLEPETEPVLVAAVARQVALEVSGRSPGHRFVVDIPSGLPPAEGDPSLLAQVLRNLYDNAVKYAPNGGDVVTTAQVDHERVRIDVRDQGVGIAPEHVSQVFERFRRPGADPTVRGMGLGLYLSRLLVEAQGGTVFAGSPGPGLGATFTIILPIARGWSAAEE